MQSVISATNFKKLIIIVIIRVHLQGRSFNLTDNIVGKNGGGVCRIQDMTISHRILYPEGV